MDPTIAAAATGAILVASGALREVGGQAGRSTWAGAARLVERVRVRFQGDSAAVGALERAQQNPTDESAVESLQQVLLAYMQRDQAFDVDIRRMVDEAVAAQSPGQRGTVNAAVIKNAQIFNEKVEITGDWNVS